MAAYVPRDIDVFFHSENGIVGMSPLPGEGVEDRNLTDVGGDAPWARCPAPAPSTRRSRSARSAAAIST